MGKTKIEWADKVWNPVTGCTKVSAGCKNCYAERIAMRRMAPEWRDIAENLEDDGTRLRQFTDVHCHLGRLENPLNWRKPRKIFVCSMGDLFHEKVHRDFILRVWRVMEQCPQHTFQILTKRPERMQRLAAEWIPSAMTLAFLGNHHFPLPNVWLGVSVEDQAAADDRIPLLLQTPAAVRFVSIEPMLGQVGLAKHFPHVHGMRNDRFWVICGSESGPNRRPTDIQWIRSVRDQCVAAGVPLFLKQMEVDGKLVKMPVLDGRVWDEFPGVNHG